MEYEDSFMKIEEIGKLAKMMQDFELTEFALKSDDISLKMKRGGEPVMMAPPQAAHGMMAPHAAPPYPAASPTPEEKGDMEGEEDETEHRITVDSPIVGTFYTAPAPDAPPFVKVGDDVQEDTVVCIVEAMKVMNEIKAEKSGTVRRILVDNATPVEYGQPLFELETT